MLKQIRMDVSRFRQHNRQAATVNPNPDRGGLRVVIATSLLLLSVGCADDSDIVPGDAGDVREAEIERTDNLIGAFWTTNASLPGAATIIRNSETHTVSGSVFLDGEPVAGAQVWAHGHGRIDSKERVITDNDGIFHFELPIDPRMRTRTWTVSAFKETLHGRSSTSDGNAFGELTIEMKAGRRLQVVVKDRETDEAITTGCLFVADGRVVEIPDSGIITLDALSNNVVELLVASPEYERRFVKTDLSSLKNDRLIVRLSAGTRVAGRVTDRIGKPVANNPVQIAHGRLSFATQAHTDDKGEYVYVGAPANQPLWVRTYSHATNSGSMWEDTTLSAKPGEVAEANFVVDGDHAPPKSDGPPISALRADENEQSPGGIRGRVLLPDGTAATDFEISYEWPRDWKPGEDIISGGSGRGFLFSPDDGRFQLAQMEHEGAYRLIASATGYRDAVIERVNAVEAKAISDSEELILQLSSQLEFTVHVEHQKDAKPIAEADVWLIPDDPKHYLDSHTYNRRRILGHTNESGKVVFSGVPFNSGVIIVEKPGLGTDKAPWRAEDNVTLKLAESADLTIDIERPFFGSSKSVQFFLQRKGSNSLQSRVADEGDDSVTFENITAAKYSLSIDGNYKFADDKWEKDIPEFHPGEARKVTVEVMAND